jgi:hypothetical protein
MIPIAALGPFAYRAQISALGKADPRAGQGLYIQNAKPIRELTAPGDIILTDLVDQDRTVGERTLRGVQRALPWYADRPILVHEGTETGERNNHTREGIRATLEKYPSRKAWYYWQDQGPEQLFEQFNRTLPKHDLPSGGVLYDLTPLFASASTKPSAPATAATTKPAAP